VSNCKSLSMTAMTSLLFCVLTSSLASADKLMEGWGTHSCKYVTDHVPLGAGWGSDAVTQGIISWIEGFASGANVAMTGAQKKYWDLDTISIDEQWGYVMDYCRRNPDQDLVRAVDDMVVHRMRLVPVPQPSSPSK
jgi:hypothetical protein